MSKFKIKVKKPEVSDPHVGLTLEVTQDPGGNFDPGNANMDVSIAIQGESAPETIQNIPVQIPESGSHDITIIKSFTDAQYQAGLPATVQVSLNGQDISDGGIQTHTQVAFQSDAYRYWMPGGNASSSDYTVKERSILFPGHQMTSENQLFKLVMERVDSQKVRLAVYNINSSEVSWSSQEVNYSGYDFFAMMLQDANFCIYGGSFHNIYPHGYSVPWCAWQSSGERYSLNPGGPVFLKLENDGKLNIYKGGVAPDEPGDEVLFEVSSI